MTVYKHHHDRNEAFAFATILERPFPLLPWYNLTSFQNQFLHS